MLFVRRPSSLSEREATGWMREQAEQLASAGGVNRVQLIRLRTPALQGGADCEWLIEMHCRGREEAARAARDRACRDLIGDLRLLGMHPRLLIADGSEPEAV
jgi:hypothetical protein